MGFSSLKCRALEQQRERRLLYWRKASSIGKVLDIWKDYLPRRYRKMSLSDLEKEPDVQELVEHLSPGWRTYITPAP